MAPSRSLISVLKLHFASILLAITLYQIIAGAAVGAILATGNVLPVYPETSPDPWNVGSELIVGDFDVGSLQVSDDSDVMSSGGTAGFDPGVIGAITLTGAGSTWTNSQDLFLGVFGIGQLNVLDGAQVENRDASIGHISGVGQVTVSGMNSLWTNSADLVVGAGGVGSLSIEDRGRVRSADATVALNNASSGTVTINGEQSTWEIVDTLSVGDAVNGGTASVSLIGAGSRLYVGAAAIGHGVTLPMNQTAIVVSKVGTPARLSIYEGNSLQNAGVAYIGSGAGESGAVEIDGESSILANEGGTFVGLNGAGTLSLIDGGTISSGAPLSVGANGTISGVGTVIGTLSNSGIVQPGNSIGTLTVEGDYTQSAAGKLRIDLAGAAADAFDTLSVTEQATLGGTLEVDLSDPFVPQLGDAFPIVSAAGGVNGTFAAADLPTLGVGKMWQLMYSATSTTLAVKLAGDYNDNGIVDAADYTVWRDLFGKTLDPRADGNTDGVVDLADFNIWKTNFGLTLGSGSGEATLLARSVPEPATMVLLAPIALALRLRRRRS